MPRLEPVRRKAYELLPVFDEQLLKDGLFPERRQLWQEQFRAL